MKLNNKNVKAIDKRVANDKTYGKENKLITSCLKKFPNNTDVDIVAMKIGLIDITNSTHISQHKSKISVVDLAKRIVKIKDIDQRIKNGDPEVVNEIARSNGKINLFSFASKYCCYHNRNLYGKDDYSIYDNVLKEHLSDYFDDVTPYKVNKWRTDYDYEGYNNYIADKLKESNITVKYKRRKFDHFVWYLNK